MSHPDNEFNCEECQDGLVKENCQECCDHEWDPEEGGMCINCGREDFYNFIGEGDYEND